MPNAQPNPPEEPEDEGLRFVPDLSEVEFRAMEEALDLELSRTRRNRIIEDVSVVTGVIVQLLFFLNMNSTDPFALGMIRTMIGDMINTINFGLAEHVDGLNSATIRDHLLHRMANVRRRFFTRYYRDEVTVRGLRGTMRILLGVVFVNLLGSCFFDRPSLGTVIDQGASIICLIFYAYQIISGRIN